MRTRIFSLPNNKDMPRRVFMQRFSLQLPRFFKHPAPINPFLLTFFLVTRSFNHVAAAPLPSSPFLFGNILFTLFASDQCQIISFVFKGFSIPMTALNDAALSFIFIKLQIFINVYLFKT